MSPEFLKSVGDAVAEKMLGIRKAVGFLSDQIKGVQGRIDALEARAAVPGPKGSDGKDGRDGKDGERGLPGADGKDAEPIILQDVVSELVRTPEFKTLAALAAAEAVSEYFKANPVQHGKDGRDGINGKDGRDGMDGKDGAPGRGGERGEKGEKGEPGRDGLDIRDMLRNADDRLVAVMSDGTTRDLGVCVGKDGRDGIDGKSYEGHSVTYDPATHEGVIRTLSGIETRFPLPGIIGRGYWREGQRAKSGEAWTHDGTMWIAKCDTNAKPETGSDDWFIGARKGRDAK